MFGRGLKAAVSIFGISCIIPMSIYPRYYIMYSSNETDILIQKNPIIYYTYFWSSLMVHKMFIIGCGIYLNYKFINYDNNDVLYLPLNRLLIHDFSKFYLDELIMYAQHFHGDKSQENYQIIKHNFLNIAWPNHSKRNPHHYQYFLSTTHDGLMPHTYVVEMMVDWFAAQLGYNKQFPDPASWSWLTANWKKQKAKLHPDNAALLQALLCSYGFHKNVDGFPNTDGLDPKTQNIINELKDKWLYADAEYS